MATVEELSLHLPSLQELASVLQSKLENNFANVEVQVKDCPDLRQEPFTLVAQGLCGNPKLLDVGGVPNLLPTVKLDKSYNLDRVAELAGSKGSFLIGAGAGPFKTLGINSELIANVRTKGGNETPKIGTYIASVEKDGSCKLCQMSDGCTDFLLMGNFLACDGKPGKVIEVRARRRTGQLSFVDAMQFGLKDHYGTQPVGLGGTFAMLHGKAHVHVMPTEFSKTPIKDTEDLNKWLLFYDVRAPLVCVGVVVSHDPGFDLRLEHFHGFGRHGEGGHYHWDVTPDQVEYLGYFVATETLYRIDRATNQN